MDFAGARRLAEAVMASLSRKFTVPLAILDRYTRESPHYWVFTYNSRAFVDTGDYKHSLRGGGPFLVTRKSGYVFSFGSAHAKGVERSTYGSVDYGRS